MTLRFAKSALAARWPASATDAEWFADVDTVDIDELWLRCPDGASMVRALVALRADRRIVARAIVACFRELRPVLPIELVDGPLACLERFADGEDDVAGARAHAAGLQVRGASAQKGVEALASLALGTSLCLVDPSDPVPVLGAEVDCIAEALEDAGLASSLEEARSRLADAVRRAIPRLLRLEELDRTVGEVPVAPTDDVPF